MDINTLPQGTSVLVDANVFIYYLGGMSPDCRSFLQRVGRDEVEAHITTTIIAEVLHRRMMAEAISKGLVTASQVIKKLKANPSLISLLTDYITEVEELLRLPFQITEVRAADIAASHPLRRTHKLFVNDSINLACAERLRLTNIVTHDTDFSRVPTLSVWQPTDV